MAQLNLPCDEAQIRALRVGEPALLSGRIITGRDTAHHWLVGAYREEVAPYLAGSIIYHCGPVVRKNPDGTYDFVAAGPTTSAREEPYQADVIGRYGVRGVIGKGGMFDKTRKGLVEESNQLGIGPMGFGGKTTVVGVKIGTLGRVPASYFVSIAYLCWAARRATAIVGANGDVTWPS